MLSGTKLENTMSLEKTVTQDKIEIIGEFKTVQVRTKTAVLEDGAEISASFHRHTIIAGQDYSNETAEVQSICGIVHTSEVIAAREAAYPSE